MFYILFLQVTEMTACLDHQEDYKHDLDLEMITMDHNNT